MVRAGDLVLVQGAILNKQDESFIPCSCDAFMIKHRLEQLPAVNQYLQTTNNIEKNGKINNQQKGMYPIGLDGFRWVWDRFGLGWEKFGKNLIGLDKFWWVFIGLEWVWIGLG